jgi:hypothetical protein
MVLIRSLCVLGVFCASVFLVAFSKIPTQSHGVHGGYTENGSSNAYYLRRHSLHIHYLCPDNIWPAISTAHASEADGSGS